MLLDLAAGRVDGVVSDVPGMEYAFTKMQGLAVVERIKTGEQYGLMVTKDSPLVEKLNGALTEMKKDGTLQSIHKKWFGTDAPAGSSTVDRSADAEGLIETALSRLIVPAKRRHDFLEHRTEKWNPVFGLFRCSIKVLDRPLCVRWTHGDLAGDIHDFARHVFQH